MRTTIFSTPLLTPLLRLISVAILKITGWHTCGEPLAYQRCVLIGAPHTSNWDFPLMLMVVLKLKLRVFWMGKHTLFPFPFGWFMQWLGGIPIDRSAAHNVVNETVKKFAEHEQLIVLVPPEGTRKKVTRWKTGFYHIACNASVPILLGYINAPLREAGFADFFTPTGDLEKDFAQIRDFYKDKQGLCADNS